MTNSCNRSFIMTFTPNIKTLLLLIQLELLCNSNLRRRIFLIKHVEVRLCQAVQW
jgi:hypothetical protein